MNTKNIVVIGLFVVVLLLIGYYLFRQGPTNIDINVPPPEIPVTPASELTAEEREMLTHIDSKKNMIVVSAPVAFATVTSPLNITGEARGGWYFEADFPVRLLDANGKVLASHYASAVLNPNDPNSTWMTNEFVPFSSQITFTRPTTATGTLILDKSNPSGLSAQADQLRIPVRFTQATGEVSTRKVNLYYYNSEKDKDASGNVQCTAAGLVAVQRDIPVTQTPIQDTISLLLRGELTAAERAQGLTTEFPLSGVTLSGANLASGVLTLGFNDPNNRTGGGSCRIAVLWAQIRQTALQFDGVSQVRFTPDTLFQP
ncbi:MAG TPA: Gmad2 immunoglobulin-like domain-containing protein [Candidatus Paceibacterota bacterium]|nr:Gmad2 immunoglobulin-like domain-containing protein [Candidatus Paceibacterota bacterium]